MTNTQIKRLKDKYLPLFLGFFLFSSIASGQTYNSSVCCTVSNKSYGPAQSVSTDGRSWFYDATNFVMRDYNGTTEVFSYLNLAKYRSGHFPVFVHSGGILQGNGVWLGGITLVYWFKDSTGNANLVRWYTDSTSGCTSCLQIANNLSDLANATTARTNIGLGNVDNTSDATKNAASVSLTNHTINGSLNTLTNIPNSALTNNTIGVTLTATGSDISIPVTPASLGGSITINIPTSTASVRGALLGADWSSFHLKVDSTSQSNDTVYDWHNGTAVFRYVQAGAGTGISSLNGLTATTQLFQTGTAGSDFNIVSAVATHTFNIPVANASNTGKLSNTDWSVFNAKEPAITPSNTIDQYYNGYKQFVALNTDSITEGSNHLFFTNTRARGAITLTTSGSSGAATYNTGTGVLNVPNYSGSGAQTFPQVLATGRTLSAADSILLNGNQLYFKGYYTKHDSILLSVGYFNPIIGVDSIVNFGTSITAGLDATTPDSNYVSRQAHFFGLHDVNLGVSSSRASNGIQLDNAYINPGHMALVTFEHGFNDLRADGAPVMIQVLNAYNAAMINQYLSSLVPATDATVTLFGTGWTTAWDAAANAGGKTHNGAYNSVINDSLSTITAQAGTTVAIGFIGQETGAGSLVGIRVDDVFIKNIDLSDQCFSGTYIPTCTYITGLANTTHKVTLFNSNGVGQMIVDYIGIMGASPKMPFQAIGVPYQVYGGSPALNNTKALTDTLNAHIALLVASFVTNGFPVFMTNLAAYYTGQPPEISGDDIHPANLGHAQMALAAEAALVSPASSGVLQYGNDGFFYGSGRQIAFSNSIGFQNTIINNNNVTAPLVLEGNGFNFGWEGFGNVDIDSTILINGAGKQINVDGQFIVGGTTGSISLDDRTGATGFTWVGPSPGSFALFDNNHARDQEQWDQSFHHSFNNVPWTHGSYTPFTAVIDIMGNQNGTPGATPLGIGAGQLVATPEPNKVENDSVHLYWTDQAGVRHQLDQQGGSVAAGSSTDIQYNTSNALDASSHLTYDATADRFTVGGGTPLALINAVKGVANGNVGYYARNTTASGQTTFLVENDLGSFASYGGFFYGGSTTTIGDIMGASRANKLNIIGDGANNLGVNLCTLGSAPLTLGTNNVAVLNITAAGAVTAPFGTFPNQSGADSFFTSTTTAGVVTMGRKALSSIGGGVTAIGTFSGSSQTNGGAISGSTLTFGPPSTSNPGMVKSGTYTPTLTNSTNLSSSGLTIASYEVAGNVVTVRISGVATATLTATATVLTVTLPFSTATTSQGGVGAAAISNFTGIQAAGFGIITGTTTMDIRYTSLSAGSDQFAICFQYVL